MTVQEAAERIHQRAWTSRKPGLERIRRLLERLGNPQRELKFVHIAGSNGKGSTAALLSSVLACAGWKTGLYTSPHLWDFRERFQVNGLPISEEDLSERTAQVLEAAEDETEFELITAIGMLHFLRSGCDIVVLETGLGGRLDSTNIIDAPEAAVITHIGLEHTELLGDTLEKIAAEKAGIIKPGGSVVLYQQDADVLGTIQSVCRARHASLTVTAAPKVLSAGLWGQTFTYREKGPYHISLLGEHQVHNAAAALETVNVLRLRGWEIPEAAVVQGLEQAQWPGRLERAWYSPNIILDGGHNPQCMEALSRALERLYPGKKLIFITGVLADKDYPAMMGELLPLAKEFYTVAPDSPRAMSAADLAVWLERRGAKAYPCESVWDGLDQALAASGPQDVLCACGSLYMIGEIRHILGLC